MLSWVLAAVSAKAIAQSADDGEAVMLLQLKAESRTKAKWEPTCEGGTCENLDGAERVRTGREPVYTADSPCVDGWTGADGTTFTGGWITGDGRGSWDKPAYHGTNADLRSCFVSSREECIVACQAREGGNMPNDEDIAAGRTESTVFRQDGVQFFNGVTFPLVLDEEGKGLCMCEFNMIDVYTPEEGDPKLQPGNGNGCDYTKAWDPSRQGPRSVTRHDCQKDETMGAAMKIPKLPNGGRDPLYAHPWQTCLLKKIWTPPPCDWSYGSFFTKGNSLTECRGSQTLGECLECAMRVIPNHPRYGASGDPGRALGGVNFRWRNSEVDNCFNIQMNHLVAHRKEVAEGSPRAVNQEWNMDWMYCAIDTYKETTTTTTTSPDLDAGVDAASAVDDPHIKTVHGHRVDLQ